MQGYSLAVTNYIEASRDQRTLRSSDVEGEIISAAMHYYDNASNGNKTRGSMKKVVDM